MIELTVLGCSGSFGSPAGGACSGYLVRTGGLNLWLDCGNGTLANLQRHMAVEDLTAVVISHAHPDHCVDLYGLHVMAQYALARSGIPVYGPAGLPERMGCLVDGNWGDTFAWHELGDGDRVDLANGREPVALRFSRTDHPVPTLAVEVAAGGKRLIYTGDTGPGWSVEAFGPGADLVLSEATFQAGNELGRLHLSARQAGAAARAAKARRLVLTHLWPGLDPMASAVEGSEAFGAEVTVAAPGATYRI